MESTNNLAKPTYEEQLDVADKLDGLLRESLEKVRLEKSTDVGGQAEILLGYLTSEKRIYSPIIPNLANSLSKLALINDEPQKAAPLLNYVYEMCHGKPLLESSPQFAECLELLAELALGFDDPEISLHYLLRCQTLREQLAGPFDAATLRVKRRMAVIINAMAMRKNQANGGSSKAG